MQCKNGWTALKVASYYGQSECVKILLSEEGRMRDNYGRTALMSAARNGYSECVRILLKKEAGMQDENGWTALMKATRYNKLECARLLAEKERNIRIIYEYCGLPFGTTALDIAKQWGYNDIVSLLQ